MLERDAFSDLLFQEVEMIWDLRLEIRDHYPVHLAKLLSCVQWNNHIQVALVQPLLQIWPELSPTDALELLDFKYADATVREFAVKCLRNMRYFFD